MGDWLKVEFWAQLPDGMQVYEIDHERVEEELARFFGFSRVANVTVSDVNDGKSPPVRTLYKARAWNATRPYPSS